MMGATLLQPQPILRRRPRASWSWTRRPAATAVFSSERYVTFLSYFFCMLVLVKSYGSRKNEKVHSLLFLMGGGVCLFVAQTLGCAFHDCPSATKMRSKVTTAGTPEKKQKMRLSLFSPMAPKPVTQIFCLIFVFPLYKTAPLYVYLLRMKERVTPDP